MKTILSVIFYFLILVTYSQAKIIESEFIKSDRKINYPKKSSISESGDIVVLSASKKGNAFAYKESYTLIHFSKNLEFIKQKELKKDFDGDVIGFEVVKNIINIIVADKNEFSVKKITRYYCSIEDLNFKEQTLYESKNKEVAYFSISENKEHFSLVVGERKVRKNMYVFEKANEILVFNNKFELKNRYDVSNLQTKNIYNVIDIFTLNNSTTLLFVREKKDKNNFLHKFIVCSNDSKDIVNISLEKDVKDLKIFTNDNEVYLAGHYTNKKKPNKLKGFYFSKVNLDNLKNEKINFTPFTDKYISDMELISYNSQADQTNNLEVLNFFETKDSYVFINEATNI